MELNNILQAYSNETIRFSLSLDFQTTQTQFKRANEHKPAFSQLPLSQNYRKPPILLFPDLNIKQV